MLVANIEIWPHGFKDRRKTLATVYVANVKQQIIDEQAVADYQIVIEHGNGFKECRELKDYVKGDGAIKLVARAIENSEKTAFNSSLVRAIDRSNGA